MSWAAPQSTIRIGIFHRGEARRIDFAVDAAIMDEARSGIDHAKEQADNLTRTLCTLPTVAAERQMIRERLADAARSFVFQLLSEADTVNGYPPGAHTEKAPGCPRA
jgi:hypothetical protein